MSKGEHDAQKPPHSLRSALSARAHGNAARSRGVASPYARFKRAIDRGKPARGGFGRLRARAAQSLRRAKFCDLLARLAPDRFERAALRWHGRWTAEGTPSSLAESQLALTCLQLLTGDHRSTAVSVLRHLAKR